MKKRTKANKHEQKRTNAKPKTPARRPRQARLVGMDDPAIEGLESMAELYAEIRDKRMKLNVQESDLKKDVLSAMKRYGKSHYHHGGVDISVETEKETVHVKIDKAQREADSQADASDEAEMHVEESEPAGAA